MSLGSTSPQIPASHDLVTSHIALVGHVVRETMSRVPGHVSRDDLTSAGLTALVQAGRGAKALRGLVGGYDDPYPFRLLAAIADRSRPAPHHSAASAEFEPLSEREQIVLRYLPTGLSNKRIAAELHMSVNTLKTHLKSIYRKLGAGSRDESVAHARQFHLL